MHVRNGSRILLALLGAGGGIACGGSSGGTGNNPATVIAKTGTQSGDAQSDTVGDDLSLPLRVVLTDNGAAKADAEISWSIGSGGGTITSKDTTDASGIATATWTLGTTAGAQTAKATFAGASGSPITFTATATADAPATLAKAAGDNQTTVANAAFVTQLKVHLTDQFGNAVQGKTVTWVTAGPVTTAGTSVTAANGDAVVTATAGATAGAPTVVASVVGVAGQQTFNLNVLVPSRTVNVANISFTSVNNGSTDAAVDTIAAGQTVFWHLVSGTHTVESLGPPSFSSSGTLTAAGYFVTFANTGTYQYDCNIHTNQMTGRIVVQ